MALPEPLKRYQGEPGLRTYAKIYRMVEKEYVKLGAKVVTSELLSKKDDRSALRRFFALEKADDADHWLSIDTLIDGRLLRLTAPFRRGLTLPYSLEIRLRPRIDFSASYRKNLLRAPQWEFSPLSPRFKGRHAELEALKIPKVGWRHDSSGLPVLISEGMKLAPAPVDPNGPTAFTVISAYQGFLFNVGPRVTRYVEAVPRLEALLDKWNAEGGLSAATSPSPAPSPSRASS